MPSSQKREDVLDPGHRKEGKKRLDEPPTKDAGSPREKKKQQTRH
jgi:hypothetical protein